MQVMVSVLSRRSAFETRQVIRETWASGHNNVFFAVGVCCPIPPNDRIKWACKRAKSPSVEEQSKWDMECAKQDLKIAEEKAKYKDIIRMPDIDVYRHLPQKVKFSYKWGLEHTTAEWFVKTDDDSVVRIDTLGSYLKKTYNSDGYVVVGRIANGWGVPRSGKWAENKYKPSNYPKFPLGSVGHVVSKGVATYIVENSDKLFNYQGEDVSIGIWLNESPLKSKVKWVTSKHMANHGNCKDTGMWVMGHNIKPAKMRECFAHKDEIISVLKAKKPELKTELKTKKPELKTRQPVLKAKKPELKAKKPDENNNCHKQINIEEYCKKHTCGDQLEDLEIETKNIQTKTKQTSILLNLNTFYKLQEKEKVFSWTSTTVGMVNYFNIIQHKTTAYLYYRCDCIQFNPKEQGGCVCLRTSQDNGLTFSKEIRIPKISNCLAFYVFIDTKPGTKPEEIFKAVYGVNERHGDGQWMAAASSDGLVWKDLGPIWNRAKLIRSSSLIYAFDALNTVYYDNDIGRYVAYARSVKQWSSRGVMHASTSDFMNWPNKNWQEVEFDPPLKSGESLYLMNGLKCPLPNCPYNMGFSSLYNSHENNDCNAKGMMLHHADCEEGYQDTFFTIGSGNTFKRPSNFNVFDRKSEQYFPRNTWPAAGSIVNEEEETVSYYIAHDVNLPNSYLQRYTMPFYRWASQSCQEEECTISYDLGLASDIEDIKLNIKTYSMHSKVTYSLIFGDQQSFSCNHANAAAFMGNEKAYSIRFGYQKWEHVKRKYASTHATGGIPMVYDWYNKNPREKWPLKMPKKGMNYKNCYFNSLQCLSKTDPTFAGKVVCKLEIKMKHADLYAIDVEKKSIDPNAAKDTGI